MEIADALSASPALYMLVAGLLGLLVGSFLNVVIHRLPKMMEAEWRQQCVELDALDAERAGAAAAPSATLTVTGGALGSAGAPTSPASASAPAPSPAPSPAAKYNLVTPRSACPKCGAPIGALQNVPVVSWLVLRGRCANCGTPISPRYPFVELTTGVLSALVAWQFGWGWESAFGLVITWFLIAMTGIDFDTQLLPDSLTLPLLWLGLLAAAFFGRGEHSIPVDLQSAVLGAAFGYLSLWSIYHLFRLATGKEGMGYGDFKLFGALGAWLGWQMLLPIILFSAATGAALGIGMILLRRHGRDVPMPFGPFLAAAGWLVMMYAPTLVAPWWALAR
jgi:leader peptidase (prepilin peptidase)/N-methyltransferase